MFKLGELSQNVKSRIHCLNISHSVKCSLHSVAVTLLAPILFRRPGSIIASGLYSQALFTEPVLCQNGYVFNIECSNTLL